MRKAAAWVSEPRLPGSLAAPVTLHRQGCSRQLALPIFPRNFSYLRWTVFRNRNRPREGPCLNGLVRGLLSWVERREFWAGSYSCGGCRVKLVARERNRATRMPFCCVVWNLGFYKRKRDSLLLSACP